MSEGKEKQQRLSAQETVKLLIEQGREIAVTWTKSAVEGAQDADQMGNALLTLEAASIHFLATLNMNRMLDQKLRPEAVLADQLRKFKSELMFILAANDKGELKRHTVQSKLVIAPANSIPH